jgi:GTP cyclohydrolase I
MLMKAEDARNAESGAGTPVSVKIRERIVAARKRFHSNDNIAAFIEPGELELLLDEVERKMQAVLDSMVIDTASDHNTNDTARRVAKLYLQEVFRGRYTEQPRITEFPNVERLNELMIVGPITVRSACSHHLCPVMGKVWVGIMPNEHTNVIGLSKYARLAEWVMGRPQIQEEAVVQLADLIMDKTQPDGLARCERRERQDDQLGHARRLPEGRHAAPRIPGAHSRENLICWSDFSMPAGRWTPAPARSNPSWRSRGSTTRPPASPASCAMAAASSCRPSKAAARR